MSPSETIYFFLFGVAVLVGIMFIWLIFRRRKKWAISLSGLLVIGYVGSYFYYPALKVNTHAERYEQVKDYLGKNYPNEKFTIIPKHYEEGYTVGQFDINTIETPTIGVTLRVDKEGQVKQIGTWTKQDHPKQQELWREIEFIHGSTYSLDKEIPEITKQDEWIEGQLTAFALTINDKPAIAIFNYSSAGYSLLDLQQGEREGFVSIEEAGYAFIYIDKKYQGETVTIHLKNGEEYTLNVDQHKGKLIVQK
ncbi:hypothetical protein A8F94_15085 [Bacillus sp. FJAT-27225]|uniref:hypothetical protein n=1 Tax=Bacillus sp. FJAT-27225 TaxID=1743144 RepID=UPI00080C2216|nr:hypothetical protein [Bacillus sp. FJAT-27225]OCA84053.1 hypothetical protein A8F94_15085 [Bacillus sp. FJAT-27225]